MEPTKDVIKDLSDPQRREIQRMQKQGSVTPTTPQEMKVYNYLYQHGIAIHIPQLNIFSLKDVWKTVDVSKPPSTRRRLCPATDRKRLTTAELAAMGLLPDKPKVYVRPAADYDNRTRGKIIDQYLN